MNRHRTLRLPRAGQLIPTFLSALVALLGLSLVLLPQPAMTATHPSPATPPNFAAIDAYIQAEMQATRLPGLALGIVQGDRIVHLRGFGQADPSGRPVTPQTPFLIASVTKSFTALAVMQLVEAGKVELDAPVQRYLPFFRVADPVASARITVRQLLNHTSGLPALTGDTYAMVLNRDLGEDALEQRVRALRTTPLIAEPGQIVEYSNPGYATLALLVQVASGQSYTDYLQQHIYAPLQMQQSFVSKAEAQRHGMATGYRYWFGVPVPHDWSYSSAELGAGFTISSAEDLTHYLIAHLNGGRYGSARILSPAGITELQRPAVRMQTGGPGAQSYGMGWFVRETDGVQTVEHPGIAPNFHADLVLVPAGRWGLVLLMNGHNNLQPERIDQIAAGVTGLLVGRQPPSFTPNNVYLPLLRGVLAVDVLVVIGVIWTVVSLRRWRARPARRPRGWVRVAWHVVPPLVLNLLWALVCLVALPLYLGWPLRGLLLTMPDFGYTLVLSGTVALAWSILGPVLLFRVLYKREQLSATEVPAMA